MKSMRTGRQSWSWGMRVVPPCGRGQLYGLLCSFIVFFIFTLQSSSLLQLLDLLRSSS